MPTLQSAGLFSDIAPESAKHAPASSGRVRKAV